MAPPPAAIANEIRQRAVLAGSISESRAIRPGREKCSATPPSHLLRPTQIVPASSAEQPHTR
jgi:hypothetical protein